MSESYRFIAVAFTWALFLSLVYFSVFRSDILALSAPRSKKKKCAQPKPFPPVTVFALLAAAFAFRCVLAYFGKSVADITGPFSSFAAEQTALAIVPKVLAALADLAAAWFLYQLCIKSEKLSSQSALTLSLLWAINPASVMASTSFVQTATVSLSLLFCAAYWAKNDCAAGSLIAGVLLGFSIFFHSIALYFLPLFIVFVFFCISESQTKVRTVLSVFIPAGIIAFIGIFFRSNAYTFFLPPLATPLLPSGSNVATVNAFNFYSLMDSFKESWYTSGSLLFTSRLFFLSVKTWGYVLFVLSEVLVTFLFARSKNKNYMFFYLGLLSLSLFVFVAEMQPLFAVGAALCFYADFAQNAKTSSLLSGFLISAASLMNLGLVSSTQTSTMYDSYISATQSTVRMSALLMLTTLVLSYYQAFKSHQNTTECSFVFRPLSMEKTKRMVALDWIILAAFTLIALFSNFWHLGDMEAPSTAWSAADGRQTVIETEETPDRMTYYLTLGETGQALNADFSVETSADGSSWTNLFSISESGYSYTWYDKSLTGAEKYLRFTLDSDYMNVLEIGLWRGTKQVPVKVVSGSSAAFDEPELAAYGKTYMNSMYFDEVYHGRTAYEVTQGVNEYEWTHPPLGKLIMSLGISVFGMVPFGWRFTGALFGVLLVPLMYLFGKKLFARTLPAAAMAGIMLFDPFRFAQSRIGTIDTYAVVFIILMYYFMYDFYTMEFTSEKTRWQMWRPLLFSGIFFGIGCAAKWIGFYAGVGLAILFFMAFYRMYKENSKLFEKTWLQTVAACTVFFVLIPFVIYYASYLPHLHLFGYRFSEFVSQQQSIYRYHSNLNSTHSYSSAWYMWPFMIRPVYMSSGGSGVAPGFTTRIVGIGNPAVWWAFLPAFVGFVFLAFKKMKDRRFAFLLVAFLAQYLPWVLISRTTYQYHFFASLPFLTAMLVYLFAWLKENFPKFRPVIWVYGVLVLVGFFLFFPVVSGLPVPSGSHYFSIIKAFDTWNFF